MNGWPPAVLSDVVVEAKPGFACGEEAEDGVFQFRMNNITTEGQLDLSKKRRVPRDTRNIDNYLVEIGDVLFNATNSPELVGKTAFFPGLDEPAVFSNHFLRLRPDSDRLDGRFLSRWLNYQFERGRFKGMCRQWVNQATVNRDALLAMRLPLPTLAEQRRIAEILDKTDALRAKRRAALAQLDSLIQSIFLDLFGEPASNPKRWPVRTVNDVAEIIVPTRDKPKTFSGDVPWVTLPDLDGLFVTGAQNNLSHEEASDVGNRLIPAGSVLLSCAATVGRAAIAARPVYANQQFYGLVPRQDTITAEYLCLYFGARGERFFKQLGGSFTIAFFSKQKALDIPLPVPPLLLQRQLTERVTSIEKLTAVTHASLVELNTLFGSTQHLGFRGEL